MTTSYMLPVLHCPVQRMEMFRRSKLQADVCARPAVRDCRPTFPSTGLCLVALHIFETLQQRQIICLGGLSLTPGSLRLISSLHTTCAVNQTLLQMFGLVNS